MEKSRCFTTKLLSSLVKVFLHQEPRYQPECAVFTALKKETISFQVAYSMDTPPNLWAKVAFFSPIQEYLSVREVVCVPCAYPGKAVDDFYLRDEPGLYPDLLRPLRDGQVQFVANQWKSLWLDVTVPEEAEPGTYPITVQFQDSSGVPLCEAQASVTIFDACLPEQTLIHTEWFHGDCLADYYQVPVFSEAHWQIMERFIAQAAKRSVNMILTPQFTPPLDTEVGGERTTIQLVDVSVSEKGYQFGFDRMERWIHMCKRAGIRYFELSHLFTQWGANAAPKVIARVDGEYRRLFGWDTPAVGGDYTEFLRAYLPQLTQKLREWGIDGCAYFHISDEPQLEQLDSYRAAKDSISAFLQGFPILDALSDYGFYQTGTVDKPICSNDHIQPFLEHGVPGLWTYYCVAQSHQVSNRFFSMPSVRNRILGLQLFKYEISGFLHWGYNFYRSQFSRYPINPYQITDAMEAFPGGDAFLVYPGEHGIPEESIRMLVLEEAVSDLRAADYLAKLTSREHVIQLMEEGLAAPITFSVYPKSEHYLLSLRNRINREIVRAEKGNR